MDDKRAALGREEMPALAGDPARSQPSCQTRSVASARGQEHPRPSEVAAGDWDSLPYPMSSPGDEEAGAAGFVPRVGFGAGGEEGRTR